MRILIVNSHRGMVGGVESYLKSILPRLADRGHAIGIVYEHPQEPGSDSIDRDVNAFETWRLSEPGRGDVLKKVREWMPNVVYSHGLDDEVFDSALRNTYPYVLYAHNYYGACATGRKCHMFPQPRPCDRRLGPMCLVLHYPRRCGGLNPVTAWRSYRRQSRFNSQLGNCRAILVASTHMQREFQRNGVSPDQLFLAPLPTTEIAPSESPSASEVQSGQLLFLGRLTDLKGGSNLIQAIPNAAESLQKRLTLTVAGDGPERLRLEDMARKLGIQAQFVGWVNNEQKLQLLRRAELLVVPSVWPEPFGLVGLEAGCVGLPAVGYAVGGIPDWLIPGCSGELASGNPPTVDGLAGAIVRALGNPVHYSKLRDGAWNRARMNTVEGHVTCLESIFGGVGRTSTTASLRLGA